jgi:hypothetical protein
VDCISCGLPSGYNRVLVEGDTEAEIGGLCIECEERQVGDRLRWDIRAKTEPEGCALCARDAHVRAPEWDPEMEASADGTAVWVEYRVTETTPGLCEEHFEALVAPDAEAEPTPGPSRRSE